MSASVRKIETLKVRRFATSMAGQLIHVWTLNDAPPRHRLAHSNRYAMQNRPRKYKASIIFIALVVEQRVYGGGGNH